MKRVVLGTTGVRVSALCLGCMYFGTRLDEPTAYRLADAYFDAGGRFFDTANNYAFWIDGAAGGESEALLGRWARERGNRDQILLATKAGANPAVAGGGLGDAEGLAAATIERAVEASLKRLRTDYLDLYYAHIDDRATPLDETLAAFDRLVQAGKVRAIGCSNTLAWRIEKARNVSRANQWAEYCCVQQRYSYLRPRAGADLGVQVAASDELLDYLGQHAEFTLLAYSPLLGGAYTRPAPLPEEYQGPDSDARLRVLARVAGEVDATPNQVVLAWMLCRQPAVIPLIAASTVKQLRENLGALAVTLDHEQVAALTTAGG